MTIDVNFRVVGLYLGSVPGTPPAKNATGDVQVTVQDDPTVKDVTDAVRQKASAGNIQGVTDFRYTTKTLPSGAQVLDEVEVDYSRSPKTTRNYPPGTYSLRQELHSDPNRVFQYYIYDVEERQNQSDALLRKNTDNTFRGFNRSPTNTIQDGDYVVWRLLTIDTHPQLCIDIDWPPIDLPDPEEIAEIEDPTDINEFQQLMQLPLMYIQDDFPLARQTMEGGPFEDRDEPPREDEPPEEGD